jgi:CheY-like chemotaxis protein
VKDESEYTVLLLDDDPEVIATISSLLAMETDYNVLVFTSASEAAKAIETQEIDLAVVDFLIARRYGWHRVSYCFKGEATIFHSDDSDWLCR